MSSFYEGNDPDVDTEGAQDAVEQAQAWAIKADGPVDGDDYSSLWNADLAATSADGAAASASAAAQSAADASSSADQLNDLLLASLVDVSNLPPADGQVLAWSDANQMWEPTDAVVLSTAQAQALLDEMTSLRAQLVAAGLIT